MPTDSETATWMESGLSDPDMPSATTVSWPPANATTLSAPTLVNVELLIEAVVGLFSTPVETAPAVPAPPGGASGVKLMGADPPPVVCTVLVYATTVH